MHCSETDEFCKNILNERGYKNYDDLNTIDKKFDLIIATHVLEHVTNINDLLKKFKNILNQEGYIFLKYPIVPKSIGKTEFMTAHIYYFILKKYRKLPNFIV